MGICLAGFAGSCSESPDDPANTSANVACAGPGSCAGVQTCVSAVSCGPCVCIDAGSTLDGAADANDASIQDAVGDDGASLQDVVAEVNGDSSNPFANCTWQDLPAPPLHTPKVMAAGPTGTLFIGGGSAAGVAEVLSSSDALSWSAEDSFLPPNATTSIVERLAVSGAGEVYSQVTAAGPPSLGSASLLRRKTAGAWQTSDTLGFSQGVVPAPNGGGVAFVGGQNVIAISALTSRVVRRSANGGASWQTAAELSENAPAEGQITTVASGSLLWATSSTKGGWLVRGSSDLGSSWVDVDLSGAAACPSAIPFGVAQKDGALFLAGACWSATSTKPTWVVLKGVEPPSTQWAAADVLEPCESDADACSTVAAGIAAGASAIVVVGAAHEQGADTWRVRASTNGSDWWTLEESKSGVPIAVVAGPNGSFYVLGLTAPGAAQLRKLQCASLS